MKRSESGRSPVEPDYEAADSKLYACSPRCGYPKHRECQDHLAAVQRIVDAALGVEAVKPLEPDYEAASDLLVIIVNSGVDPSTETWRLLARDVVDAALRGVTDDRL